MIAISNTRRGDCSVRKRSSQLTLADRFHPQAGSHGSAINDMAHTEPKSTKCYACLLLGPVNVHPFDLVPKAYKFNCVAVNLATMSR